MIKVTGIKETMKQISAQLKTETLARKTAILDSVVSDLKLATPVDTGEARDGWKREGDTIVNNVEHIAHLNRGSSKQAPSFFIESTILKNKDVKPFGTIVRET